MSTPNPQCGSTHPVQGGPCLTKRLCRTAGDCGGMPLWDTMRGIERVEWMQSACRGQELGEITELDATRKRSAFYSSENRVESPESLLLGNF